MAHTPMIHPCSPAWWHHNILSVSKTLYSECETPDALWVTTALKQMCYSQTLPSTHVCAWHNNCACCVYDLIHRKYTHITDAFSLMTSSCSVFSWGDSLNEIILLRLEDDIISWATADDCTAETRTHTHTSSCLRHNLQKDPKPSFVNKWRFL